MLVHASVKWIIRKGCLSGKEVHPEGRYIRKGGLLGREGYSGTQHRAPGRSEIADRRKAHYARSRKECSCAFEHPFIDESAATERTPLQGDLSPWRICLAVHDCHQSNEHVVFVVREHLHAIGRSSYTNDKFNASMLNILRFSTTSESNQVRRSNGEDILLEGHSGRSRIRRR